MAVFRVEKNANYTVMSNHHLRNNNLTLKAKGLLSLMLSLPDTWRYTTNGLSHICKEGVDGIGTAVKELEKHGYIVRRRLRNEKGQLSTIEYTVFEEPQSESEESVENKPFSPRRDNPVLEKLEQAKPILENPVQLNTNRINKDIINTQSINPQMKDIDLIEKEVEKNIEFATLSQQYGPERIREITMLIAEAIYVCRTKEHIYIGGNEFPVKSVEERFLSLKSFHIEYVMECMEKTKTQIQNVRAYMITALYNAPLTIDQYYEAQVRNDMD